MSFIRGERVRVNLNSCYRYYLDGLEGTITSVMGHAVVVVMDNPPSLNQRIVAPPNFSSTGRSNVGPKTIAPQQYMFQFHELVKLPPLVSG